MSEIVSITVTLHLDRRYLLDYNQPFLLTAPPHIRPAVPIQSIGDYRSLGLVLLLPFPLSHDYSFQSRQRHHS